MGWIVSTMHLLIVDIRQTTASLQHFGWSTIRASKKSDALMVLTPIAQHFHMEVLREFYVLTHVASSTAKPQQAHTVSIATTILDNVGASIASTIAISALEEIPQVSRQVSPGQ